MTIPKGNHCYEPVGWIVGGETCTLKLDWCENYSVELMEDDETKFGYCNFLRCRIYHQCKLCGINEEWYGE